MAKFCSLGSWPTDSCGNIRILFIIYREVSNISTLEQSEVTVRAVPLGFQHQVLHCHGIMTSREIFEGVIAAVMC